MAKQPDIPATLITRSLTPLLMISLVLMCLGGMVLLLHGHMGVVLPAVGMLAMGQLVFPFLLLPAGMMAGLWQALHAHHAKAIVRFFAVASIAYIAAIMSLTVWLQSYLMSRLPPGESVLFSHVFLMTGALTPWAVFALRDRRNQLFIIMLWSMLAGMLVLLPLKLLGSLGSFGYAAGVWAVMLVIMFLENIRENQRAAKLEAAAAAHARAEAEALAAQKAAAEED